LQHWAAMNPILGVGAFSIEKKEAFIPLDLEDCQNFVLKNTIKKHK
jgi:hypothetical protein